MVKIYTFPNGVVASGPTISRETLSKACPGVSVRTIGYLIFDLDSFWSWQLAQALMKFWTSDFSDG